MAFPITQGGRLHGGAWQSSETFAQSTATNQRSLDANTDVSFLGMGTATNGPVHNLYKLQSTTTASGREGDAVEGFEKFILATATGRADIFIEMAAGRLPLHISQVFVGGTTGTASDVIGVIASATATIVFQAEGDFCHLRFMNGVWHPVGAFGCTLSDEAAAAT